MTTTQPENLLLTSTRPWHRSPILTPDVLEPLYDINWDFLTTLTRVPRQWQAGRITSRLPDPAYLDLVALDPYSRRDAARVPFTLYSGRFLEDRFWGQLATAPAAPVSAYEETDEARRCLSEFARLALFFAWHLARANAPAARLVMGMPGETVEIFRELSPTKLRQIALDRAEIFTPRWAERTAFWKRLLGGQPAHRTPEVLDVGLIGIQMLAGEMVASATLRQAENRRKGKQ